MVNDFLVLKYQLIKINILMQINDKYFCCTIFKSKKVDYMYIVEAYKALIFDQFICFTFELNFTNSEVQTGFHHPYSLLFPVQDLNVSKPGLTKTLLGIDLLKCMMQSQCILVHLQTSITKIHQLYRKTLKIKVKCNYFEILSLLGLTTIA
jgi:hypothetical protein